jgi:lipoprotein signal peptidase
MSDDYAVPALRHLPSHLRLWVVAGVLLVLDLWSKHWVFANLSSSESRPLIPHVIAMHRSLNDGAVFGSFTGQVGLFIVASLFALVFVFYLFAHSSTAHRITHIALAMVLAGALGNLYDRAVIKADVVRYATADGQEATIIGKITGESDGRLEVATWPDGPEVHRIRKSEAVVRRQGVVRDFIKFVPRFPAWFPRWGGREMWPWVFNIADASLVCGVAVLFLGSWFERGSRKKD